MWMEQKIIPMVIFMSSTPLKGASGHKQASHVKAGFTRCHSHRLFDIFLSSGGNRQKKAEIWRKKMSIKIVRLSVAFIVNAV